MMRKAIMTLAAAAVVTAGPAPRALALHGGGGGHFSGGGHFGGGFSGSHAGPGASHGDRAASGHFDRGRFEHGRFHDRRRFVFFGDGFPYWYDDDGCYARVWTHRGWRWRYVCY